MLCYVKIDGLDCEDRNELMAELVSASYAREDDQARWGGSEDCIVVAANTNPSNSAGRVHLTTIAELADRYSCDVSFVEKDHTDGPGRNELERCAGTGDWYYSCELKDSPDGMVCEEYFDDNFCACECGCVVRSGEEVSNESGDNYCRDCYSENYSSCEVCGCEVHTDDAYYSERHGGTVCGDHYNDGEGREFNGRRKSFDESSSFGSTRYFGLELETDCGEASDNYAFDAKTDGSINGMEYVSHKLRGDAGLKEAKDFMASGDGIEVNNDCGFHLHIDMRDMSQNDLYAVYAAFIATEDWWVSEVDGSRDDNSFCQRIGDSDLPNVFRACALGRRFANFAGYRDRYLWINLNAFNKFTTFENRLHHGTWSYRAVERWVVTNLRFVEEARKLRFLAGETIASFKTRAAKCLAKSLEPVKAAELAAVT